MIKQLPLNTYKSAVRGAYEFNLLLYAFFRPVSLNIQHAFTYIAFTHLITFNVLLTLLDGSAESIVTETSGGFLLSIGYFLVIAGFTKLLSIAYILSDTDSQ